jgi:hypothetical protein
LEPLLLISPELLGFLFFFSFFINLFKLFIYSYVHTLFGSLFPLPPTPSPPRHTSRQNLFCTYLYFC